MLESNNLIVYAFLIIPIIFLYLVNRMNHSRNDKRIEVYKNKIIFLNENIKQLKENSHNKAIDVSHNQKDLKKNEELLLEIEKHKKKIADLSSLAKEAMRTKYDFVSNMRHEVRTPLNSIMVFSEMLKNSLKDEKLKEYAKNISTSGNNLLIFVDKIIELGEVELGNFKVDESALDIKNFLKKLTNDYKRRASEKGLLFSLDIDSKVPESIVLDGKKVKDILINMLENALKFTSFGSIKVFLKLDSMDKVRNSVNISFIVKDSGKGIDSNHLKSIFDVFEKKEDGEVLEYQSTGLGLSINKKVAKLIGGDIKVRSKVDQGSEFILSLNDVEIVLENKTDEVDENSIDFSLIKPSGATIAVIDNEQRNIDIVVDSFKSSAVKVLGFTNTRLALESLKSMDIDLIYIDAEILTMDDAAVAKMIKLSIDAPVITLVLGRTKDIEYSENGVMPIEHIKKPISKLELFKTSLMVLNSQSIIIEDKNVVIDDSVSNKDIDIEKLKHFLERIDSKINILYNIANSSNDFNAIKVFAQSLLDLSKLYEINSMYH